MKHKGSVRQGSGVNTLYLPERTSQQACKAEGGGRRMMTSIRCLGRVSAATWTSVLTFGAVYLAARALLGAQAELFGSSRDARRAGDATCFSMNVNKGARAVCMDSAKPRISAMLISFIIIQNPDGEHKIMLRV